jgi:hypothetical protein
LLSRQMILQNYVQFMFTQTSGRQALEGKTMRQITSMNRVRQIVSFIFSILGFVIFVVGLAAPKLTAQQPNGPSDVPNIAPGSAYRLTTLLSDIPGLAPVLDPLLVNPW